MLLITGFVPAVPLCSADGFLIRVNKEIIIIIIIVIVITIELPMFTPIFRTYRPFDSVAERFQAFMCFALPFLSKFGTFCTLTFSRHLFHFAADLLTLLYAKMTILVYKYWVTKVPFPAEPPRV